MREPAERWESRAVIYPTGRLPADPQRLAAAPAILAHVAGLTAPPDRLLRSGVSYTPRMGANADIPDCTAEAYRECATAAAAVLGGYDLNVSADAAPAFYAGCVGLPPGASMAALAATDGANMLDVAIRQWSGPGFATGFDTLHALFGTVPIDDRAALALASLRFGLGWWGIRLYERDMDQLTGAGPLDDEAGDPGALLGGHAIGGAYEWTGLGDRDEMIVVTYGMRKPAKWSWARARLDEAHAFRWRQLDAANTNAIDEAALDARIRALGNGNE